MISSREATLQLIQREISEVMERERELKQTYTQLDQKDATTNGTTKVNSSKLLNGTDEPFKHGRLFTQNSSTKGAMHRFIKSRGKSNNVAPTVDSKTKPVAWSTTDNVEIGKPVFPVGVQPRNGYVPIKDRLRKEFLEMEEREVELTMQRTKSQPDLLGICNSPSPEPPNSLQSARSISQLSDSTFDSSVYSSPTLLKAARSLADLCDLSEEEDTPPGSISLIKRWESLIQKNINS